jgi:Ca2+-binding RTX toxin-like protein
VAVIAHVETIAGDGTGFLSGVTALLQVGDTLYSCGSWGGGLAAYSVDADGLTQRDRQTWGGGTSNFAEADLVAVSVNGQSALLHLTPAAGSFSAYLLSPDGLIAGGRVTLAVTGGIPDRPLDAAAAEGRLYFAQTDGGVAAYDRAPDGALTRLGETGGGAVNAIATAHVGGTTFVIAAETDGDSVAVFRPVAGGLALVDRIGAAEGLGLNAPSQVEVVSAGGQQLVILGSQQSGTVTVLRLSAGGDLVPVDHVTDTLGTRFGTLGALAVAQDGDGAFLAVAGEDGVSVLRVLPTGRLVHVATLADEAGFGLDNVAALSIRVVRGDVLVTAASATEPGLSAFRIDLSDEGAVIVGNGRTEQAGTARADILVASGGDDVFRGANGADTFVFFADGSADRVVDFQAGVDRLDLASVPLLYSVDQLTIVPTATGAFVHFGALDLTLVSSTGGTLTAADLHLDTSLQHLAPGNLSGIGRNVSGTVGADTLEGSAGTDFFRALAGADWMVASEGEDRFDGGPGHDVVSYADAPDRVFIDLSASRTIVRAAFRDGAAAGHTYRSVEEFVGGRLGDWMIGNAADNVFSGRGDADRLEGRAGADRLLGGDGGDDMLGNRGTDVLFGGNGDDTLRGQQHADRLIGGGGDDVLTGGAARDVLTGGAGADVFVFNTAFESGPNPVGRDRITDFRGGTDWFDLSAIDANVTRDGNQAFQFIGSAAFGDDVRQLRYQHVDGRTIILGDINADGIADFSVELDGLHTLSVDDFKL